MHYDNEIEKFNSGFYSVHNDFRENSMDSNPIVPENSNILDLTDVYEESGNVNNQEVIVIDGRGYDNKKEIYNLVDVIEDTPMTNHYHEEIIKLTTEIVERIARELIPEIAERVIKEEIEKLKKMSS